MPDISKLPELAELFGTTIDELLGRRCPVLERAATGHLDEHLQTAAVTVAEAAEAAPFLPAPSISWPQPSQMTESPARPHRACFFRAIQKAEKPKPLRRDSI